MVVVLTCIQLLQFHFHNLEGPSVFVWCCVEEFTNPRVVKSEVGVVLAINLIKVLTGQISSFSILIKFYLVI